MCGTGDVDLAALQGVTAKIAESVRAIRPDQRDSATPCSEWDLTALTDHITGGNWFTAAILTGARAQEALTVAVARFGGRSATAEEALHSLTEQMTAFLRGEVLDRTWNHLVGNVSGRQILRLRLHDLIVHSWDIDETLQPGAALPEDLLRWGLNELRNADSSTARHFGFVGAPPAQLANNDWTSYLQLFGRAPARGDQPPKTRGG